MAGVHLPQPAMLRLQYTQSLLLKTSEVLADWRRPVYNHILAQIENQTSDARQIFGIMWQVTAVFLESFLLFF